MRSFLLKYLLVLIVPVFIKSPLQAQLHSFGSNARPKPMASYKFGAYGYFDLVRSAGLGLQYQLAPAFSMDASLYAVRPNHTAAETIKQNDYLAYSGGGISFSVRYHFSRHSAWYAGPGVLIEYTGHKAARSEISMQGSHMEPYYTVDASYGHSEGYFITLGYKRLIGNICLEPYMLLGNNLATLKRTVYSSTSPYAYKNAVFPLTVHSHETYINFNIGIKIGLGFKKNIKQATIDKKFDAVYLPRYENLQQQYSAIPDKRIKTSEDLKLAKKFIRVADKQMQKIYKLNYGDTLTMYRKMDAYLQNINSLLLSGNGTQ